MSPDFEYTIKLSAPALQAIATALQDAPFKIALPIINEIQRQVTEIETAARAAASNQNQEAA